MHQYAPIEFDYEPDAQELYDAVVLFLVYTAGQQSAIITGGGQRSCRYRNDGLMCAAGALVPEEYYRPEFEYHGAYFHR